MQFRQRVVRDDGETLVEVLVASTILGIGAVAILTALQYSVEASDMGRKQSTGGTYVRSLAEAVQNHVAAAPANYQPCAAGYVAAVAATVTLPSGYTPSNLGTQTWNGASWVTCTAANDRGAQRVHLQVAAPVRANRPEVKETLYVVIRQACNGPVGAPC